MLGSGSRALVWLAHPRPRLQHFLQTAWDASPLPAQKGQSLPS